MRNVLRIHLSFKWIFTILYCTCLFFLSAKEVASLESETEIREKQKLTADKIEMLKSKVGRQYWILPNYHFTFYQYPDTSSHSYHIANFTTSFFIRELLAHTYLDTSYYKIELESGILAYIKASTLDESDTLFQQYIFTKDLEEEEAKLQAIHEAKQALIKSKQALIKSKLALIKSKIGDKLPSNYKGHDIKTVHKKYSEPLYRRNEFEKTEDYEKRLQSINTDDIYVFRIVDKNSVDINYDPDREEFTISIDTFSCAQKVPNEDYFDVISLMTSGIKTSSYIGSNAFGATVPIKKFEAYLYAVRITKGLQPEKIGFQSKYIVNFTMPLQDAKKYKGTLNVLLISKPDNVLSFFGRYKRRPTISSPIDLDYGIFGINVELLEIWIYDLTTGKIFFKQDISSQES